jgi:hypothetical protein
MTHGPGFPSHVHNAVIGRFLGLEVLGPYISWIEQQGYRDAAARLRSRLYWLTNETLDDPDTTGSLDDFLARLVDGLKAESATFKAGPAAAVKIVLDELESLVVLYTSAPYDPLARLADAAAITAADYYRAFRELVPEDVWRSTHPVFSFVGGKIGLSFWRDIHVQLWTEFGRDSRPTAQVFVKISPRWLDSETIAVLPRALLHEYVAHVPQGPHAGQRAHPDAGDLFAEGWMDYIADCIHKAVLERRGPSVALSEVLPSRWTVLYEEAAARFFVTRCALDGGDWTSAARREGWAAARQMHDLLRRLPETAAESDELLFRLSFELNVSKLDNVSRSRFVAKVRLCLQRASLADVVVLPLRDWAAGYAQSSELFERIIISNLDLSRV